jgi:hypothetical protein
MRTLKSAILPIFAGSATVLDRLVAEIPGERLFYAHAGASMSPTLQAGDLLEIVSYGRHPVRTGDVILCLPPRDDKAVVHRVLEVTPEGIHTRGDNSSQRDPWHLQREDVVGQVVGAWRSSKRRRIAGGPAGRLDSHLKRWGQTLDRGISFLLHPIYSALARWGIVRPLLPARLRPRVVLFQANGRNDLRLLLGRRMVGRYDQRLDQWQIQRPLRLFVDERVLHRAQMMAGSLSQPTDGARTS